MRRFFCASRLVRISEEEKTGMVFRSIAKVVLGTTVALAGCMALARPATAADEPKRIEVASKRFAFVPAEITVKKGEPVVLVFHTEDVAHGIRFKELGLEVDIPKGKESELKFTPDKTGDFVGHCSRFCGVGHGSMTMMMHVTE
jgi:cytochrome c oxidase subunit 2